MSNELYHHGILGQKWGVRRYQNSDGSLTPEGRTRYLKHPRFGMYESRRQLIQKTYNAQQQRKLIEKLQRKKDSGKTSAKDLAKLKREVLIGSKMVSEMKLASHNYSDIKKAYEKQIGREYQSKGTKLVNVNGTTGLTGRLDTPTETAMAIGLHAAVGLLAGKAYAASVIAHLLTDQPIKSLDYTMARRRILRDNAEPFGLREYYF